MNKKTDIEYEDAPSGYVTFYNYKEPLMKFTPPEGEGFGFVGALVFDGETDKIQCHFCGQWFDYLSNHLQREHALSAEQYKTAVGLNKKTALLNEAQRAKLIVNGLEARKRNLRPNKKHSKATRAKISATLKENRDEQKNLRGTCPEQLIERLVTLYNKLERTPMRREIAFIEALEKTYGSMKEACNIAGIPYRFPGLNLNGKRGIKQPKVTEEACMFTVRDFFDLNGRLPLIKELPRQISYYTDKYGREKIFRQALALDGRYRKTGKIFRYTKEELINFLLTFEKINGRKPSYSDCKRGLLPNLSRYTYNFGGWQEALKLAFSV